MLLKVTTLFDLPFFPISDYHGMWLQDWVSYNWQCVGHTLRYVENVVIPHCVW